MCIFSRLFIFFFFQAEDGIRDVAVTGVQTCALPILTPCFRCSRWPDEHVLSSALSKAIPGARGPRRLISMVLPCHAATGSENSVAPMVQTGPPAPFKRAIALFAQEIHFALSEIDRAASLL